MGWQLNGHPFIKITPLYFSLPGKFASWIFFSSKNAVNIFFSEQESIPGVKYGALGPATAQALKNFVHQVDFTGEGTDTREIANRFSEQLHPNDFVWFPGAADGKRTVQQQLPDQQYLDIPIYYTVPTGGIFVDTQDLVLFTSPSNVEGFLINNEIGPEQKIMAIGKTTAEKLESLGFKANVASGFSQLELFQSIASILL